MKVVLLLILGFALILMLGNYMPQIKCGRPPTPTEWTQMTEQSKQFYTSCLDSARK